MSFNKPDYARLRGETPFSWFVGSGYYALLGLVKEMSLYDVNTDPEAMIELYRKGMPLFERTFDERVRRPAYVTPAVSYAHINALGVELVFPKGGEVNYERTGWSLDRLMSILREDIDYSKAGMIPFFLGYWEKLKHAFPDENVGISLGYEGPLTTAYELRDMMVFTDVYDEPERFKQFMKLMVESTVDFAAFRRRLEGHEAVDPSGCGMCDDVASMFGPSLWPEFVLPYMHQYYDGLTSGNRSAHIEDLTADHLHFLEDLGLVRFDPSISPKISPPDLYRECRVPFGWRLGSFHYMTMDERDVRDWVFQAVADGASSVFTHISHDMTGEETVRKVRAFMDAAESVERKLGEGATSADLAAEVSPAGKKRFWGTWPD